MIESQYVTKTIKVQLPMPELVISPEDPVPGETITVKIDVPKEYKQRLNVDIEKIKIEINNKEIRVESEENGAFKVTFVADEPKYEIKAKFVFGSIE